MVTNYLTLAGQFWLPALLPAQLVNKTAAQNKAANTIVIFFIIII
jgi:hypothetical protein